MILEIDKEGKIYYKDHKEELCEESNIKPITNLISKNSENGHFYVLMNKKNYNKITKYGRAKYLDDYGEIFVDSYAYVEYNSLYLMRIKRFFKEYIYPRFLSLFRKVVIYTDVVECKRLARKEGLSFAKQLNKAKDNGDKDKVTELVSH